MCRNFMKQNKIKIQKVESGNSILKYDVIHDAQLFSIKPDNTYAISAILDISAIFMSTGKN